MAARGIRALDADEDYRTRDTLVCVVFFRLGHCLVAQRRIIGAEIILHSESVLGVT